MQIGTTAGVMVMTLAITTPVQHANTQNSVISGPPQGKTRWEVVQKANSKIYYHLDYLGGKS